MDAKERIAFANRIMQNFKTTLVLEDDKLLVFDWRDPESGNLSTRYYVDKEKGKLIISGDSGDCVASWYGRHNAEDFYAYLNDEQYFMGKINCTTNKYTYEREDIEEDLNTLEKEFVELCVDCELTVGDIFKSLERNGIYVSKRSNEYNIDTLVHEALEPVRDWFDEYAGCLTANTIYALNLSCISLAAALSICKSIAGSFFVRRNILQISLYKQ